VKQLIKDLNASYLKKEVPEFEVGDSIQFLIKIKEGEKEREQRVEGTVMAKKGSGLSETFTVIRTAYGTTTERVFMLHSPNLSGFKVIKAGRVRRAKLHYLRGRTGKSARIQERVRAVQETAEAAPPANA
jgi:large subunit ribosomal protein L19